MSKTLSNIYDNATFALRQHVEALTRLQEQAATGSRVNRASDDPSVAYRILGLNSQERSLESYMDNLLDALSVLTASNTAIDSVKSAIANATAGITTISGTSGATGIATAIDNWLEDIVSAANTSRMGQYLFGGSDTNTAPYLVERTAGKITGITYRGSLEKRDIEVSPGVDIAAFYVGDDIFRADSRSAPVFAGETGAAAGTGTSSVKGDLWLTVTGSAGNYTLSIDGGLSTFNTDGTDTNLAVTDSRTGEVLYVDTTGITSTGTEWVRVPGTYDIFNTLITIRDRLESGLSTTELEELRSNALEALKEIRELLVRKSVSVGSKMGFLDDIKEHLQHIKYDTEDDVSRLQDADIAQIAIDISRYEVLYQMSLSVVGKLMSMSLLDFIQ